MEERSSWIKENLKQLSAAMPVSSPAFYKEPSLRHKVGKMTSVSNLFKLLEKAEEDSETILQRISTLCAFPLASTSTERAKSRRYEAIRRATPPWLTKEHREEMKLKRDIARRLTKTTGILHVVDHIVPLQGENICGLHVPWNMQVITAEENSKKSNKFPYDVLDTPEK